MGNPVVVERGPKVRVAASASTWIEGEALRQLDATAGLPGMRLVVGLPDLHPGKGGPVGAAYLSFATGTGPRLPPATRRVKAGCGSSARPEDATDPGAGP